MLLQSEQTTTVITYLSFIYLSLHRSKFLLPQLHATGNPINSFLFNALKILNIVSLLSNFFIVSHLKNFTNSGAHLRILVAIFVAESIFGVKNKGLAFRETLVISMAAPR